MYGSKVVFFRPEQKQETVKNYRMPAVDIIETQDSFKLLVNLPGIQKENLDLKVAEQVLTITAELNRKLGESEQYLLHEIRHSGFKRSFKLSDSIQTEGIEAELQDGVLTVALKKKPESQPRTITIK